MNADDIQKFQALLRERSDLLGFLRAARSPRYVALRIPNSYEVETKNLYFETPGNLMISDQAAIAVILDRAKWIALEQVAAIEKQLTAGGISFAEPNGRDLHPVTLDAKVPVIEGEPT